MNDDCLQSKQRELKDELNKIDVRKTLAQSLKKAL